MQLLNIFNSGGLWVIPFVILFAGIYLIYLGYKQSKSGSLTGGSYTNPKIEESDVNVPIYKCWAFIWGVALILCDIFIFISIGSDYKGV